jgi:hypothetical protein
MIGSLDLAVLMYVLVDLFWSAFYVPQKSVSNLFRHKKRGSFYSLRQVKIDNFRPLCLAVWAVKNDQVISFSGPVDIGLKWPHSVLVNKAVFAPPNSLFWAQKWRPLQSRLWFFLSPDPMLGTRKWSSLWRSKLTGWEWVFECQKRHLSFTKMTTPKWQTLASRWLLIVSKLTRPVWPFLYPTSHFYAPFPDIKLPLFTLFQEVKIDNF